MKWADVATAGAFVLGVFAGAIGTIRVMRMVMTYLHVERENEQRKEPDEQ